MTTHRRLIGWLTVLLLLASALLLGLVLTRSDAGTTAASAAPSVGSAGAYVPAEFAAPAGPALAVAVDATPATLSYTAGEVAQSRAAATDRMTGAFARAYRDRYPELTRGFARARLTVTASVTAAGVIRVTDPTHVLCLVDLDQRSSSAVAGRRTRTAHFRVRVSMAEVDGAWLIDGLQPV